MGVMFAIAPCFACKTLVSFNPDLVPSHENHPICQSCVDRVNPIRRANGLPEITVLPGAYEPADEC